MTLPTDAKSNKPSSESGFGIIDSLIALAIMSVFLMFFGLNFVSKKDQVAIEEARIQFDGLIAKVLITTEDNAVCDRLNIINSEYRMADASGVTLYSTNALRLGGTELIKVGTEGRVRLKKIELVQMSRVFGVMPRRAKAQIRLTAEYLDREGRVMKNVPQADTVGLVELMIEGLDDNIVRSCYGRFSERIKCLDMRGSYSLDREPNCRI